MWGNLAGRFVPSDLNATLKKIGDAVAPAETEYEEDENNDEEDEYYDDDNIKPKGGLGFVGLLARALENNQDESEEEFSSDDNDEEIIDIDDNDNDKHSSGNGLFSSDFEVQGKATASRRLLHLDHASCRKEIQIIILTGNNC